MLDIHRARGYQLYEEALKLGVSREMARLFLPAFGVYYTAVATIDAHNLLGFLRLRDHEHAQHEIRVYAQAIREIMRGVMPWTMEAIDEDQS
jgi:thymidylate synthase (FAD)